MTENAEFKLYIDGSYESQKVYELLKKARVAFEVIDITGKVRPELLVGDRDCPDNWLTGFEAIKTWLKNRKKNKG